jgi:hypothetical protein
MATKSGQLVKIAGNNAKRLPIKNFHPIKQLAFQFQQDELEIFTK